MPNEHRERIIIGLCATAAPLKGAATAHRRIEPAFA
jgi:hypothetical protein